MRRFVVCCCFRNPGDKLDACVESLAAQEWPNFTVCLVDDASDDGSSEKAAGYGRRYGWPVIRNLVRQGAVYNQWQAIHETCSSPDDVVVWVDGDDRLARPDTFQILDRCYEAGALLTYGSYRPEPPDAGCAPARPYPPRVIRKNAYRRCPERHSYNHLRTMTYGLFSQIEESDCQYDDGRWFPGTPDAVFMFPALELAAGRVAFVSETLLIYSSDDPAAEWRSCPDKVNEVNRIVLARPPKQPLP